MRVLNALKALLMATVVASGAEAQDRFAAERKSMLDDIARITRETQAETGRAALSEGVMSAMARVQRHRLVTPADERIAYQNSPLPIGAGQTISQPFIVALMTDLLDLQPGHKVLEIGTGSGYQAAVLAEAGANVYTVEIIDALGKDAARKLTALGYRNISTRIGDGYKGWPEEAPFDSVIVTAAAPDVPPPALVAQLNPGGKLVIPLGAPGGVQTLYVMEKQPNGALTRRQVLAVRFVPLTGAGGK